MFHTSFRHICQWTSLNHMLKKDVFTPSLYVDTNLNKVCQKYTMSTDSKWKLKHKETTTPTWHKVVLPVKYQDKMKEKRKPKIAILKLQGTIMAGRPGPAGRNNQRLNIDNTKDAIDKAFKTKLLEAVFLNINSPGGAPVQTELIADYIQQKSQEKHVPIISFVEDVAASGGYWLATAAPKILISKSSMVGSIGVISQSLGFHEVIQKLGIESRVYTAGKSKAFNNPLLPQKEEDLEVIREILSELHKNFKNQVIASRGDRINPKDEDLFSGKVWIGQQAVEKGLADGVSTIPRFIESEFGGLDKISTVTISTTKKSILENLFSSTGSAAGLAFAENLDHLSILEKSSLMSYDNIKM